MNDPSKCKASTKVSRYQEILFLMNTDTSKMQLYHICCENMDEERENANSLVFNMLKLEQENENHFIWITISSNIPI